MELLNVVIGVGVVKAIFGCLIVYAVFRAVVLPILVVCKDLIVVGINLLKEVALFLKGFFRGFNQSREERRKIGRESDYKMMVYGK